MHNKKNNSPVNVLVFEQTLMLDPPIDRIDTAHLRGAVAAVFRDSNHFHQHRGGGVIYRYPLVHYRKSRDGQPVIAAVNGAAQALLDRPLEGRRIRLGNRSTVITRVSPAVYNQKLYLGDRPHTYRTVSPLLPFNQENYGVYRRLDTIGRRKELDRLMTAHLLRLCKGLGYWVPGRLTARVKSRRKVCCRFKQQDLIGIEAVIETNLYIPDRLAVGKAVSHGYGILEGVSS